MAKIRIGFTPSVSRVLPDALADARLQADADAVRAYSQGVNRDAEASREAFAALNLSSLLVVVIFDDEIAVLFGQGLQAAVEARAPYLVAEVVLRLLRLRGGRALKRLPLLLLRPQTLGEDQPRHAVAVGVEAVDFLPLFDAAGDAVARHVGP